MFKSIKFAIGKYFVSNSSKLSTWMLNTGWRFIATSGVSENDIKTFAEGHFAELGIKVKVVTASEAAAMEEELDGNHDLFNEGPPRRTYSN